MKKTRLRHQIASGAVRKLACGGDVKTKPKGPEYSYQNYGVGVRKVKK